MNYSGHTESGAHTGQILFVPLGFLLGNLCGWKGILMVAGMSAAIESIQLIINLGIFEIDDIIHNTLGGIIGFTIFLSFSDIVQNRKQVE